MRGTAAVCRFVNGRCLLPPTTVDAIPVYVVEDAFNRLSIIERFIIYQGIDFCGLQRPFQTAVLPGWA